jgi:hypothetical protein
MSEKQLTDNHTQFAQILGQMKKQSRAQQRTAKTAQDAMYVEQRPWVGIEVFPTTHHDPSSNTVVGPGPVIRVASVEIIARNTGRTPALRWKQSCLQSLDIDFTHDIAEILNCEELKTLNLKTKIDQMAAYTLENIPHMLPFIARSQAEDFYAEIDARENAREKRNTGEVIIPNGTRVIDLTTAVPPRDIPQVHYVVGTMTYYDGIDPSKEHFTRFCVKRIGRADEWEICPFGQDMN